MNYEELLALTSSNEDTEDSGLTIGEMGDPVEPKIKIIDSKKLKTGEYSKKHIEGLVKAAKAIGVNPSHMVALALQESGLGSAKERAGRSRGEVRIKVTPSLAQVNDFEEAQQKELDELTKSTGIDPLYLKPAIVLRDKIKYAKQLGFTDEASQLQAYNGYGILTKKQAGSDTAYGVPIGEGINMKKTPLYGKRLLELSKDISSNKEIQSLINLKENPLGNQ